MRICLRPTQLAGVAVPGVWATASGVPAHFPTSSLTSRHGRETPCGRGAGYRHCPLRPVRPSMAYTDGGFAHARGLPARRLPCSSSLSYSAVHDRNERTRRGTAPGCFRCGFRAAAARRFCRARRSAAMRAGGRGGSIMRTQGAARDRWGARRPTGTAAPATFNASTPPAPSRRQGTGPGPGRRRLSPSVRGGGWLVGCPVG